ncbi:hypothetical protein GOB90_07420 [Acetobacter oeni]|nr:hypothetical protein [Acetobacter oeni]NHO18806.1 hypothetical protein [Acetobacter oeni]
MKAAALMANAGYRLVPVLLPRRPDVSAERDAALWALASRAGATGWTIPALRDSAGPDADLLFPGGQTELIEAWADLVDREMLRRMESRAEKEPRLSWRVRSAVLERLAVLEPYREAERRTVATVALPCVGHGGRILSRTINAIWTAAEDDAAGITWATKRVSLAGVYMPTFMAWLGGADEEAVARILDAGLAGVRRIGDAKRMFSSHQPARAA